MKDRKQYIVDRDFQIKMVVRVIGLVIAGMILSGGLSCGIALWKEKKSAVQLYGATNTYGDDVVTVKREDIIQPILFEALGVSSIVSVLFVGLFMVFYTHRIAGPVYKLRQSLEKLARGETVEKVSFRRNDEFQKLAEAFNNVVKKMNIK